MDTEQAYRLLTFSCGCAGAAPMTIDDHDEELAEASEPFHLGRFQIEDHKILDRDCKDVNCSGKAGIEALKNVIVRLNRQVQGQFRQYEITYIKLGQRYHSCLLRTRMRLSNSPTCALAHEMFGIWSMPRSEDPFFDIDERANHLLHKARIGLQKSDDIFDIEDAIVMTHEALSLSWRKLDRITAARFGVEEIVAAERDLASKTLVVSPTKPLHTPCENETSKGQQTEAEQDLPPKLSDLSVPPSSPNPASPGRGSPSPSRSNMKRHPEYTWPSYRWTMYNPRGLQSKASGPIKSRKLNPHLTHGSNRERERLFQKMIYAKWMLRVNGPRSGPPVDLYAIWPEQ